MVSVVHQCHADISITTNTDRQLLNALQQAYLTYANASVALIDPPLRLPVQIQSAYNGGGTGNSNNRLKQPGWQLQHRLFHQRDQVAPLKVKVQ